MLMHWIGGSLMWCAAHCVLLITVTVSVSLLLSLSHCHSSCCCKTPLTMFSLSLLAASADKITHTFWSELQKTLNDWAVFRKFIFWTLRKELLKVTYRCAELECNWCCTAHRQKNRLLCLWMMKQLHICEESEVMKFIFITKKNWLNETVSELLHVVKTTKSLKIRDIIQIHYVKNVSYKIAQCCWICLLTDSLEH